MKRQNGRKPRAELWNPNTINRFHKEGRGRELDRHGDYKPWLTVQDVPSEGYCSRVTGWKTGERCVHLFSNVELWHYYTCLWDDAVDDFREQFPLDFETTQSLAENLKIKHPREGPDKLPIVMTTDARLTLSRRGGETELCRSIKLNGSYTFNTWDIVSLGGLIAKLRGDMRSHHFANWLFQQLTSEERKQLLDYSGGEDVRTRQTLVRALNRVIMSGLIFDKERFASIYVSPETDLALNADLRDEQILRANRLLLRDAFPFEISKDTPLDGLTPRDKQKMRLERHYWTEHKKIRWELVTMADIDMILAKNVEAVLPFYFLEQYGITNEEKQKASVYMKPGISAGNRSLAELAEAADRDLNLPLGTSLVVAKHLIVRKDPGWRVDFSKPFQPWLPICLMN